MSDPSGKRRKVQFGGVTAHEITAQAADEVVEEELQKKKEKLAQPRTLLPAEDIDDLEDQSYIKTDYGPIKDVDPEHAAKRRAALRADNRRRMAPMDVSIIPSDIATAEEDYDEPEERYITDDIPVEPFHLRREREEGYFDAAGNYIQYRMEKEQVADAWLDELDDLDPNQRVEGELADRLLSAAAASTKQHRVRHPEADNSVQGRGYHGRRPDDYEDLDDDDDDDGGDGQGVDDGFVADEDTEQAHLSPEDLLAYKQRVVNMLQPGETILSALRRLAPTDNPTSPRAGGQPSHVKDNSNKQSAETDVAPIGHTGARQRALKLRKQHQPEHPHDESIQPSVDYKTFSTETSSVQAQQQTNQTNATHAAMSAAGHSAMNGGGIDTSSGGSSASKPNPSRPRHPHHLPNPEFDKLTEYADLLLSSGQFSIYERTREQLMADINASKARLNQGTAAPASLQPQADNRAIQLAAALMRSAEAQEPFAEVNNANGNAGTGSDNPQVDIPPNHAAPQPAAVLHSEAADVEAIAVEGKEKTVDGGRLTAERGRLVEAGKDQDMNIFA